MVLSYLYHWLGDPAVVRRHLATAEAALAWVDRYGDRDGDGFQEYATRSPYGYANQGWKDAGDAVPHEDGTLAPLPIAIVEHQGYVYDAKLRMADLYELLGRDDEARRLRREAVELFDRFNDAFWWEEEGTYYLALDGAKRPVRSVASNPGHLLQSGIVPPERAGRVVERLLRGDMWSGWGIRTLSSDHVAYNPFSYHTGSVWPHDNAMIAGGFRRYGYDREAATVARGSSRRPSASPFAGCPSCSPACRAPKPRSRSSTWARTCPAWAAGSVLRLVAVMAGIHARTDPSGSAIYVDPALPEWLPEVAITNLRAGRGALSLEVRGSEVMVTGNSTGFEVRRATPPRVTGRAEVPRDDADTEAPGGRA